MGSGSGDSCFSWLGGWPRLTSGKRMTYCVWEMKSRDEDSPNQPQSQLPDWQPPSQWTWLLCWWPLKWRWLVWKLWVGMSEVKGHGTIKLLRLLSCECLISQFSTTADTKETAGKPGVGIHFRGWGTKAGDPFLEQRRKASYVLRVSLCNSGWLVTC